MSIKLGCGRGRSNRQVSQATSPVVDELGRGQVNQLILDDCHGRI